MLEDGVAQKIESFQEANAPMSIVMAMDASGSMRPSLEAVKAAATTFVEALRPTDPLALVQFSDRVVVEHELTTRRQLTLDGIASHQALGGTALWDALFDSMAFLRQQAGRAPWSCSPTAVTRTIPAPRPAALTRCRTC